MSAYRTIQADGTEVFYREGGEPADTALLFLHGFPSSSAQYERLMERLEDRFHLIAPDYPGFGQSAPLEGTTTFDRIADVIDAFTYAKGIERYSLYMFDFGSPVGFRLATRHPDRVARTRATERQRLRDRPRAQHAGVEALLAGSVGERGRNPRVAGP
jgi:pimeloyl-ACP methyl ester carboxylesterase